MARATTKKEPGTALTNWDEELAKQAAIAAGMEANTGGGAFFSVKGGILQFDGAPLPGNQMCVIIVDSILEYLYFENDYDPDNPQSPDAYAFGRDEETIRWHENSIPEYAGQMCKDSDINQWGSAAKGRGKACKNSRRLALIPAGSYDSKGNLDLFDDEDHFRKTPLAFMKLPVTSVKGYGTFVKQVASVLKRPPHGIITRVSVQPDAKTQFKVLFEALDKVPNELMAAVMQRHTEAQAVIEFPYSKPEDTPAPAKPTRGRAAPAAAARTKRKY